MHCHLTVYFLQKLNFFDYSCYSMSKVATTLDFVRLGKSSVKFTWAQRMDLFIMSFCAKFGAFVCNFTEEPD